LRGESPCTKPRKRSRIRRSRKRRRRNRRSRRKRKHERTGLWEYEISFNDGQIITHMFLPSFPSYSMCPPFLSGPL
jgi:hypothetical protein